MQRTITITEQPTQEELQHNSLLFLRQIIEELDERLAGDCSPEDYETYTNLREQQRAHLQRIEAAIQRGDQSSDIPAQRPNGGPVLRLLPGRPVT